MDEWILILTLIAGGYSSPAMTQVGPFESKEKCLAAAALWIKHHYYIERSKTALCVPR